MYMDSATHPLGSAGGFHHYAETTGGVLPVSAFSAFHLLRNYNYLIAPPHSSAEISKSTNERCRLQSDHALQSPNKPNADDCISPLSLDIGKSFMSLPHPHPNLLAAHNLFSYHNHLPPSTSPRTASLLSPDSYLSLKRHRGEKKPIPEEQKDDKYFERRRRNNQAAKKSRDARKIREDQVALKATILEHENAILKAQVLTLREEASSLRQMLLMQKKTIELSS